MPVAWNRDQDLILIYAYTKPDLAQALTSNGYENASLKTPDTRTLKSHYVCPGIDLSSASGIMHGNNCYFKDRRYGNDYF